MAKFIKRVIESKHEVVTSVGMDLGDRSSDYVVFGSKGSSDRAGQGGDYVGRAPRTDEPAGADGDGHRGGDALAVGEPLDRS